MENLPNVGIVGTTEQIVLLVPIIKSVGFHVKAFWCRDCEEAKMIALRCGVPYCGPSFQDLLLLHEVELVYVATEPVIQAEVAVKALTSGKHCICQQPPSVSRMEAEKMFLLSRYYSQLHSTIECHLRFVPCFVKLRDMIANGYIGELFSIDARILMGSLIDGESYSWKCDPAMGGGVLNQLGSHMIDAICHVSGRNYRVGRVNCLLRTFKPQTKLIRGYRSSESDDFCSLQLECTNKNNHRTTTVKRVVATVLINSCWSGDAQFEFLVTGSKRQLTVKGLDLFSCWNGSEKLKALHKQDVTGIDLSTAEEFHMSAERYQATVLGCKGMLEEVAHWLSGNGKANTENQLLATFEDGLHLRAVLDAARESHRTGQWVDIPSPAGTPSSSKMSNPFWTTSTLKVEGDKPSPKSPRSLAHS